MKRLLAVVTILALIAAPLATRIEAVPAATGGGLAVPVSGIAPGGAGSFNGTLRIQRFVASGSQIVAQAVLTGIATNTTTGLPWANVTPASESLPKVSDSCALYTVRSARLIIRHSIKPFWILSGKNA